MDLENPVTLIFSIRSIGVLVSNDCWREKAVASSSNPSVDAEYNFIVYGHNPPLRTTSRRTVVVYEREKGQTDT